MLAGPLFIKYHWKHTVALFVIIVLVITLEVIVKDTSRLAPDYPGVVQGESVSGPSPDTTQADSASISSYQHNVTKIVQIYIQERSKYFSGHQDWLYLVNNTKNQLLEQSVPVVYSDLHLKLITTLDLEKEAVIAGARDDQMAGFNRQWQEILAQYYWLQ